MLRLVLPSKKYMKGNTVYIKELYKKREISKKELDDKIEKRKNIPAFLKKVHIDCRENNSASKKIIEANGGVFIEKTNIKGQGPQSLRYYIDIK